MDSHRPPLHPDDERTILLQMRLACTLLQALHKFTHDDSAAVIRDVVISLGVAADRIGIDFDPVYARQTNAAGMEEARYAGRHYEALCKPIEDRLGALAPSGYAADAERARALDAQRCAAGHVWQWARWWAQAIVASEVRDLTDLPVTPENAARHKKRVDDAVAQGKWQRPEVFRDFEKQFRSIGRRFVGIESVVDPVTQKLTWSIITTELDR